MTRLELVCWCCWLLFASACGAVQRPDGGSGLLGAGAPVSALQGRDQHGKGVTLRFPTSQPTVVYFYPKDATPGCTKEACAFRDVWRKYQERGVAVIGVSSDDVASHLAFAREHDLPFPLIADESGEWGRAFGVPNIAGFYSRVTFLVGQDGHVLQTYEAVDPGLHANQILDDVQRFARNAPPPSNAARSNDALLAPAPRLTAEAPPTVALTLRLGVSPEVPGLWMAVELAPPAGAHLSWKHLGESGLPTVIELFAPPGFHIGPPRYPAPGRYPTTAGRTAVGYTGSFVVLAAVTPDATARFPEPDRPETHAAFQVHGTWLSCDTRCTKEEVHRTLKWNGSTSPLPELPQWLSNLPDDKPPLGFAARLHRKNNTIELFSPDDWQLEDAFIEADVAPGGSLAAFTRNAAGRYVLAPVSELAPAGVVVKARAGNAASRHFLLSVTDE